MPQSHHCHGSLVDYTGSNLRKHDGIFEDPQTMNGVCQSCKRPLNIKASNTEWNDEEGEHNSSNVQPVAPVSEVTFKILVTVVECAEIL